MNDEPSSSASTAAAPLPPQNSPEDGANIPSTAAEVAERRKKNRENFNRRRGDLLDDLLKNLDILVYAELSTIYYMDCQFILFLLRSLLQLLYLTPKPAHFPSPPRSSSHIFAILASNFLCIFLHFIRSAPSAGELSRGYLHGSVAMDFIGQKGPSSRFHLIMLDFLVLGLQIVYIATNLLRQKLKEKPTLPIPTSGTADDTTTASMGQDLDDEERGVRRSAEMRQQEDIEMDMLNPSGSTVQSGRSANEDPTASSSEERESLLASTAALERTDAHIFDAFNSGQIVLADLSLLGTLREVVMAQMKSEPEDAVTAESNRRLRERLMGRFMRWEFRG